MSVQLPPERDRWIDASSGAHKIEGITSWVSRTQTALHDAEPRPQDVTVAFSIIRYQELVMELNQPSLRALSDVHPKLFGMGIKLDEDLPMDPGFEIRYKTSREQAEDQARRIRDEIDRRPSLFSAEGRS